MSALRLALAGGVIAFGLSVSTWGATDEELRPLTVRVEDADTGQPITAFEYRYIVDAASGYRAGAHQWQRATSDVGEITLETPASCHLRFVARAAGYIYCMASMSEYPIRADDRERHVRYALRRGHVVSGRVLDADTDTPIAGVRVSPTVFRDPSSDADHDRSVYTNADGRFVVAGIPAGFGSVAFEHPGYVTSHWYIRDFASGTNRPTDDITVRLDVGEAIHGVVRERSGRPVAGATVECDRGKSAVTAADGSFRVGGLLKSSGDFAYSVCVTHPGYMRFLQMSDEFPTGELQITLEPLFVIRGQVVDPEQRPVTRFEVMAGPGRTPSKYEVERASITDDAGRFSLAIDAGNTWGGYPTDEDRTPSDHWLAVRAPGYAFWDQQVAYDPAGADVRVVLRRGVTVTASLSGLPEHFTGGEATLTPPPRRESTYLSAPQTAAKLTTRIAADGSMRFTGVRPGRHVLRATGAGLTPCAVVVTVPDEDTELAPVAVQASGRVVGRFFRRGGEPWPLADGVLYPLGFREDERCFVTDEDGRFALDEVPAGQLLVVSQQSGHQFTLPAIAHIIVPPGGVVHVDLNKPDRTHDLRIRVEIGDGTEPQRLSGTGLAADRRVDNVTTRDPAFRVVLEPLSDDIDELPDMSDWRTPGGDGLITLPWVVEGRYRLRVFDWLGLRGFRDGLLHESVVDVHADAAPFPVALGAGAITGRLIVPGPVRHMPQVIAVETSGRTHPRRARCDDRGNFCVRYLPPGEYVVVGHEEANGYCLVPAVRVADDTTDVGERSLSAGADVRGVVRATGALTSPPVLRATDAHGVSLEVLDFDAAGGGEYAIANLWPGEWTIALTRGDEVLVRRTVTVADGQRVTLDLDAE